MAKETVKVTLIKSLIGRTASQKGNIVGLGLKKCTTQLN